MSAMKETRLAGSTRRPLSRGAKALTGIHRMLYKVSGGRVGSRMGGMHILLLTTTGRKSGQARTTPLTYLPDDGDYVLIASNGGKDWPPAWYGNLTANPAATIQIGKRSIPVTAATADPEQRRRLWQFVLDRHPNYGGYARKTSREIPLVILHPKSQS